jgi:hypothetical protein
VSRSATSLVGGANAAKTSTINGADDPASGREEKARDLAPVLIGVGATSHSKPTAFVAFFPLVSREK